MYDPSANQWTVLASQQVQRMYHSTACLLPDGRVFSAGSDSGTQRNTGEIFSPLVPVQRHPTGNHRRAGRVGTARLFR